MAMNAGLRTGGARTVVISFSLEHRAGHQAGLKSKVGWKQARGHECKAGAKLVGNLDQWPPQKEMLAPSSTSVLLKQRAFSSQWRQEVGVRSCSGRQKTQRSLCFSPVHPWRAASLSSAAAFSLKRAHAVPVTRAAILGEHHTFTQSHSFPLWCRRIMRSDLGDEFSGAELPLLRKPGESGTGKCVSGRTRQAD